MFWWLAQNTLIAALLALAVNLACRGRRFSPAVRHALWLAVLVKLVTPPLLFYSLPPLWPTAAKPDERAPTPAFEVIEPAETFVEVVEFAAPVFVELVEEAPTDAQSYHETLAAASAPLEIVDDGKLVAQTAGREQFSRAEAAQAWLPADMWAKSQQALVVAWLVGTIAVVVVQTVRLARFRRLLARTAAAPAWLESLVGRTAEAVGVAVPQVRVTEAACSPLVCALGRPKLLWPASLSEQLGGDSRRAVIVHELAHLRRRDHWVGWLELAASCAWWWNPLFWYVRHQLRENAELACDAWVVEVLPRGRRAYAQALIDVSELVSWTAAPVPAVGMGSRTRRTFERRLTMILRERVSCRAPLLGLALIGLLAVAALPGWTIGQVPPLGGSADDVAASPPSADAFTENRETVATEALADSGTELRPIVEADTADAFAAAPQSPAADAVAQRPDAVRAASGPRGAEMSPADALRADLGLAPAATDRDAKLDQLEAQLAQLLAEVKALRGEKPAPASASVSTIRPIPAKSEFINKHVKYRVVHEPVAAVQYRRAALPRAAFVARAGQVRTRVKFEALTRARYSLPPATAEALAKFISEYVKTDVDVKILPPGTLVVTASHEDQERIGAFVDLVTPAPSPTGASANPAGNKPTSDSSAKNPDPFAPAEAAEIEVAEPLNIVEFVDEDVPASPAATPAQGQPPLDDVDATGLPERGK